MKNAYMEQVMQEQRDVAADLKRAKRRAAPAQAQAIVPAGEVVARLSQAVVRGGGGVDEEEATPAVEVRVTGWWWKAVVVPPNAYVVHTRRGYEDPLHCGLGISFRYDPRRDSFLVVPAAMQTVLISANSICKERQGILVQGYVQWMIRDFRLAYRKLDFNDPVEPMRVVNVQLREQAEAAIKDTVALMSIDDVLSDKQPIIEELTARLRRITEGHGEDEGLGLRIVTVQIKEAVVSSPSVWESLQRPFRAERARDARLAELSAQGEVERREREARREQSEQEIELRSSEEALEAAAAAAAFDREAQESARRAELEAKASAEAFDREQGEQVRRAEREAETRAVLEERKRKELEASMALGRLRLEHELELERLRAAEAHAEALRVLEQRRLEREVENTSSPERVQERLIEALPEIAGQLPRAEQLTQVTLEAGGLQGLLGAITEALGRLRKEGS